MGSAASTPAINRAKAALDVVKDGYYYYAPFNKLPQEKQIMIKNAIRRIVLMNDLSNVTDITVYKYYRYSLKYIIDGSEYTYSEPIFIDITKIYIEILKEVLREKGITRNFVINKPNMTTNGLISYNPYRATIDALFIIN